MTTTMASGEDGLSAPSAEEVEHPSGPSTRRHRHAKRMSLFWRQYTLGRLQNSMVVAMLNIYHAYWLFAAIVVGFAIGVNLLLSWFIEWFQDTVGAEDGMQNGLEVLSILFKYIAVFMRSCLLIKLLSHLMRVAIWLLRDALRLEAFLVYRCMLCGGAVAKYVEGDPDAVRSLGSCETGWRYQDTFTTCLDLLVQLLIYISFDALPPLLAARTYWITADFVQAGTQFCIWACGVAISHVLLFHFAEMLNDIYAKVVTWNKLNFHVAQRRHRSLLNNLTPTAGLERRDSLGSPVRERTSSDMLSLGGPTPSPHASVEGSVSIVSEEELEDEEAATEQQPGKPWNICVLLCSLLEKLLVVSVASAAAAGLFIFGAWWWVSRKDPLPIIAAGVLALGILGYLIVQITRRCSRKVAAQSPKPPRSRRWRRVWRFCWEVQRWADLHCGLDESVAAPQYELFGLILLLQGPLFWYINWREGVWLMGALFVLVAFRRLLLGVRWPFGWIINFLEALSITVLAVVFNGLYFDSWYAVGTFMMALAVQFTCSRQHLKTWRVLLWMTLSLQVTLVAIVAVSMMAVTQAKGDYSNFCNKKDPTCRYFDARDLNNFSFPTAYPFCEMKFPLSWQKIDIIEPETLSLSQFAMFSALAYEGNATFEKSLARWFPDWTTLYERRANVQTKDSVHKDWTTFFELANPNNETSVFAVRGTHLPLDILQDLNIWSPIAIPQIASFIGPDLTSVAAQAVLVLSTALYGKWMQKQYYSELLKYVSDRKAAEPHRRFYITGHSLGGGLAQLVSMETEIPAITFSSPGVAATRLLISTNKTYQDEAELRLHRLAYTVVPDNDVVPRVDTQLGTQIRIGCNRSPMGCHSLGETLCDLLFTCGKPQNWYQRSTEFSCRLCPEHAASLPACHKKRHPEHREGYMKGEEPSLEAALHV